MSESDNEPPTKPAKRATKRARKPAAEKVKAEKEGSAGSPVPAPAPEPIGKHAKRRRGKKGKNGGENPPKEQFTESAEDAGKTGAKVQADARKSSDVPPAPRPPQPSRHDSDELAEKAWKIYLAEISEEGIALINDQDARDIAKRCFRLARLFLDEKSRNS